MNIKCDHGDATPTATDGGEMGDLDLNLSPRELLEKRNLWMIMAGVFLISVILVANSILPSSLVYDSDPAKKAASLVLELVAVGVESICILSALLCLSLSIFCDDEVDKSVRLVLLGVRILGAGVLAHLVGLVARLYTEFTLCLMCAPDRAFWFCYC